MGKDDRPARDPCGHSRHSTKEKVERNFPSPHWRLNDSLAVVTGLARNWPTGNVHAFARNNALLPRLLAQLFESFFGWRIGRHEKNANAASVAMIDAIAVANADVHADFR